jgi:uncharacterized coiled-coil protein SlyX
MPDLLEGRPWSWHEPTLSRVGGLAMPADTLLIIILTALGVAGLPLAVWLRAQRRIRHLEMTLLTQSMDADRYEELRALLQQVASQTEQLADHQAQLVRRLADRAEPPLAQLPPGQARPITPH